MFRLARPTALNLSLVAAMWVTAACGDATPDRFNVRDSSGVAIVENVLAEGGGSDLDWVLDPEPTVRIGAASGPEAEEFYRVRGGLRLTDGSIVVLNGGTSEIRVFDAGGAFVGAAGGEGQGPGEFVSLALVGRLPGDSILIYDPAQDRFSVLTAEPSFARSFTTGEGVDEGSPVAKGLLADGQIVVLGPTTRTSPMAAGSAGTVLAGVRPLMILSSKADLRAVLDTLPTAPMLLQRGQGFSFTRVPFTTPTSVAVGDTLLHAGTGATYQIDSYDGTGRHVRSVRLDREPRPVTEAAVERVLDENSDGDAEARAELAERYDMMTLPATMPTFRRMLVDRTDHLWVEDYRPVLSMPQVWTVFDPDGRALGRIRIPTDLTLLDVGPDWVLALMQDELALQYVVLHKLMRPGVGTDRRLTDTGG